MIHRHIMFYRLMLLMYQDDFIIFKKVLLLHCVLWY